jgi:uncharacterized OsmC-like protein
MTLSVRAEFQQDERIIFTARDRSMVNVRRATSTDGPIGFTSMELLMIGFGNCTLGILMGQDAMKSVPLGRVTAEITAEMQPEPPRIATLDAQIRIETSEPDALAMKLADIQAAVCRCPACNSLNADKQIRISIIGVPAIGSEPTTVIEGEPVACALPA